MATYLITFRLHEHPTFPTPYDERWASLVAAIRRQADAGHTWEEMTSAIILRSSRSAEELVRSIVSDSKFDVTQDRLLVVNCSNDTHARRGRFKNAGALAMFFKDGLVNYLSGLFTNHDNALTRRS